ncbi:MAG: cation:proton antiporter [Nannocystaceae bacterium]
MSEELLFVFLRQMLVVLVLARVLGEIFRAVGQPPIAGEILAGVILGQTVLGNLWPDVYLAWFPVDALQRGMLDTAAYIGVFLLLLVVGFEVDVGSAWKMRGKAFSVALTGVLVPLGAGCLAAWLMFDRFNEIEGANPVYFSLFVGVSVSITAITVVAKVLFDLKVVKSDMGLLLLSAMAINDLMGWVILALVMGFVASASEAAGSGTDVQQLAAVVVGIIVFVGGCATYGRRLVTRCLRWFDHKGLPSPATPLTFVVALGLACGVATATIGIHPIFGFFVAGLMASDHNALSEHTRSVISQMVEAVFVPLFFAGISLHVDFAANFDVVMVAVVTSVSIGGKFVGAWLGAVLGRLPRADRLTVGIAHTPGGPMGVLLALVAKEAGIVGPSMFVALVFAAIASSLFVGPALVWSLRRSEVRGSFGFFSRNAIVAEISATTPHGCIAELLDKLEQIHPDLPHAAIRETALSREKTQSTALGHGIAVPHARLDGVEEPVVVFGVSRRGIEWNAVDDHGVRLVFFILTPADEADSQLTILSTIGKALSQERVRAELLAMRGEDALWEGLRRSLGGG